MRFNNDKINKMEQSKIQKLAEDLWCDLADESDGRQTTMNYESFIKAIHKALTIPSVVFSEAELKAKLEEQLEETRQWLIDEDFEGLAERL